MWNDFTSDLGLLEDIPVKRERIEMERKSKGAQSVTFFFLLLLLCLDLVHPYQHATLISFVFLHGLDWRRLYVSQGLEDAKHLL